VRGLLHSEELIVTGEEALTTGGTEERCRPTAGPRVKRSSLAVVDEIRLDALPDTQFAALVFERGIPHTGHSRWDTSSRTFDEVLDFAISTTRSPRAQSALLDLEALFGERSLALLTLRGETLHCRAAGTERAIVTDIERWLHKGFPTRQPSESRDIPVRFWSCGSHGANSVSRTIAVPEFDEVRENYPLAARARLRRLLGPDFRPAEAGQLILWHGPPGTGKTYALRALGWEWRTWCDLHYVMDPEVFFGQRADYMLDVVLGHDTFCYDENGEETGERKWRLLVLEDTGELLAADAKERTGQGLSRLLNLVDGIIGQGLQVLVLVTTNEPLGRLHPAVARPGRCAARLEFEPFPPAEAAAWLAERGVEDHNTAGTMALANLFARVEGYEAEPERPVGFHA
jgi:hypothetical protein